MAMRRSMRREMVAFLYEEKSCPVWERRSVKICVMAAGDVSLMSAAVGWYLLER